MMQRHECDFSSSYSNIQNCCQIITFLLNNVRKYLPYRIYHIYFVYFNQPTSIPFFSHTIGDFMRYKRDWLSLLWVIWKFLYVRTIQIWIPWQSSCTIFARGATKSFFFLITATRDVYEKKKNFIYKSLREWFSMFLYRYGCVYKSFCKFNMKKNFKHLEQSKNLLSFISIPFESVVENWLHQWLIYVFYAILNDSYGCWLSYETRVRLKSLNLIL